MRKVFTTAAVIGLASMSVAHAVPVTGSFSLYGYVAAVNSTSLAASQGLNFVGTDRVNNGSANGTIASYGSGNGSFANMSCSTGACGSIKDVDFTKPAAIASFLTLNSNGVSFDLTTITAVSRDMAAGTITFEASGVIHETGYEDTAGKFRLVAAGDSIQAFSAEAGAATATFVPEPMSLALLGGALTAFGLARRRKP